MKTILAPLLLAPLLALAACGSDDPTTAQDPAATSPATPPRPDAVPAAAGPVRTTDLATVMDTDDGDPQLCLGPVAESWPPQCGGPSLLGWDWSSQQGIFDRQGKVRWGTFAVTGTWDGAAMTVTGAIPGPLYDAAMTEPEQLPPPSRQLDGDELAAVQADVQDLPGAAGAYVADGRVHVDVTYDDGSLQAWADEAHGAGVVVVRSLLVDA